MDARLAVIIALEEELKAVPRNELAIMACELFLAVTLREQQYQVNFVDRSTAPWTIN